MSYCQCGGGKVVLNPFKKVKNKKKPTYINRLVVPCERHNILVQFLRAVFVSEPLFELTKIFILFY